MEDRPTAEVDRIRDIIFGPQMRLYEQQFQRLVGQTELLSKQVDELRAALEQQKADQESRLHKAQGELGQRHSELERTFTEQLGQLSSKSEQRMVQAQADARQSLGELDAKLSDQLKQQASELKAEIRQVTGDLRKQGSDLRGELRSGLDALEDTKTNRHNLADLLIEMGTRLKGEIGIADLLGKLETVSKDSPAA